VSSAARVGEHNKNSVKKTDTADGNKNRSGIIPWQKECAVAATFGFPAHAETNRIKYTLRRAYEAA
ncbi:MAG: hypothetical protein WC165_10955, partial [Dysgonamonadaceae bacterium]